MRHLRYSMNGAPDGHPHEVMKNLGISYKSSEPFSIADQWHFFECTNVPEVLPYYLTEIEISQKVFEAHLNEIAELLVEFFKDEPEKAIKWLMTKNPHFGFTRPAALIMLHPFGILRVSKFIKTKLDKNTEIDG